MANHDAPTDQIHDGSGPALFLFEAVCVITAASLVVVHLVRFISLPIAFTGLTFVAVVMAWALADFATGIVHWAADTWGDESMPFWGPRFLRPFRVHHVTPTSFLDCGFFDTNGDTSMICIPGLLAVFLLPLDAPFTMNLAVFLVSFFAVGAPTNQIHQWAHMRRPPFLVRCLQWTRLILPTEEHQRHHCPPHVTRYCISSGVCNPLLDYVGFFPKMEWLITSITGARPRHDEEKHAASVAGRPTPN